MVHIAVAWLAAMKPVTGKPNESAELHGTYRLGPILDGSMRNTAEGLASVKLAGDCIGAVRPAEGN